jgi:hypothetical protein
MLIITLKLPFGFTCAETVRVHCRGSTFFLLFIEEMAKSASQDSTQF